MVGTQAAAKRELEIGEISSFSVFYFHFFSRSLSPDFFTTFYSSGELKKIFLRDRQLIWIFKLVVGFLKFVFFF